MQHLHQEDADYLESEADPDCDDSPFPGLERGNDEEEEEHMHGSLGVGAGLSGSAGLRRRRKSTRPAGRLQKLKDMFGGSRRIMLPEGVEGVFEPSIQFGRGRQAVCVLHRDLGG